MAEKKIANSNLPKSNCKHCRHCGGIGNKGCRNVTAKIFFGFGEDERMPIKNGRKYRSSNCPDPKFI